MCSCHGIFKIVIMKAAGVTLFLEAYKLFLKLMRTNSVQNRIRIRIFFAGISSKVVIPKAMGAAIKRAIRKKIYARLPWNY